eukprot:CFRG7682T1
MLAHYISTLAVLVLAAAAAQESSKMPSVSPSSYISHTTRDANPDATAVPAGQLEKAILAAKPGDVLELASGVHKVSSTIPVMNSITLTGFDDVVIESETDDVFVMISPETHLNLQGVSFLGRKGSCSLRNPIALETDFEVNIQIPSVSLTNNKMYLSLDLGPLYTDRLVEDVMIQSCRISENMVGFTGNSAVEALSDYIVSITSDCRSTVGLNILVSRLGDCNVDIEQLPTSTSYTAAVKAFFKENVRFESENTLLEYPIVRSGEAMSIVNSQISTVTNVQSAISATSKKNTQGSNGTHSLFNANGDFNLVSMIKEINVPTREELMEGGAQVSTVTVNVVLPGPCYIPTSSTGSTSSEGTLRGARGTGSCMATFIDATSGLGMPLVDVQILDQSQAVTVLQTDYNGQIVFPNLSSGTYKIKAPSESAEYILLGTGEDVVCQVSIDRIINVGDFVYSKKASITGILSYNADDRRAGMVVVSLMKGEEEIESTVTDTNGRYWFNEKTDDIYTIVVPPSLMDGAYLQEDNANSMDVTLAVDTVPEPVNFKYTYRGDKADDEESNTVLIGHVVLVRKEGDQFTVDHNSNVELILKPAAGDPMSTVTDSFGQFIFTGLVGGEYTLILPTESNQNQLVNSKPDNMVDLRSGESYIINNDFMYSEKARLSGRVVDWRGNGLDGVVLRKESGTTSTKTITIKDGWFLFADYASGSYEITIEPPDGLTVSKDCDQVPDGVCTLTANGDAKFIEFVLQEPNTVAGRIISTTGGKGVGNVAMQIRDDQDVLVKAETDENGGYSLGPIQPGEYTLTAARTVPGQYELVFDPDPSTGSSHDGKAKITMTENSQLVDDFQYVRFRYAGSSERDSLLKVTGYLLQTTTGKGIAGVAVILTVNTSGEEKEATTNQNGEFTFERVALGDYTVNVPQTAKGLLLTQQLGPTMDGKYTFKMEGGSARLGIFGYTDANPDDGIYAPPIPGQWKLLTPQCENGETCSQEIEVNIAGCDLTYGYNLEGIPIQCNTTDQPDEYDIHFGITTANMCEIEESYISAGFVPRVELRKEDFVVTADSKEFALGEWSYIAIVLDSSFGLSIKDATVLGISRQTTGDCGRYEPWELENDISGLGQVFKAGSNDKPAEIQVLLHASGPMSCATPSTPAVDIVFEWSLVVEYGRTEASRRRRHLLKARGRRQDLDIQDTEYSEGDLSEAGVSDAARVVYSLNTLLEEEQRMHVAEMNGEKSELDGNQYLAELTQATVVGDNNTQYIIMFSAIVTGLAILFFCILVTSIVMCIARHHRMKLTKATKEGRYTGGNTSAIPIQFANHKSSTSMFSRNSTTRNETMGADNKQDTHIHPRYVNDNKSLSSVMAENNFSFQGIEVPCSAEFAQFMASCESDKSGESSSESYSESYSETSSDISNNSNQDTVVTCKKEVVSASPSNLPNTITSPTCSIPPAAMVVSNALSPSNEFPPGAIVRLKKNTRSISKAE